MAQIDVSVMSCMWVEAKLQSPEMLRREGLCTTLGMKLSEDAVEERIVVKAGCLRISSLLSCALV